MYASRPLRSLYLYTQRVQQPRRGFSIPLNKVAFASNEAGSTPSAEVQRARLLRAWNEDWEAKQITYDEVKAKALNPSPNTVIVDVREPEELKQGFIPTANNLPLTRILAGAFGLDDAAFQAQFGWRKPTKDQEVVIYCKKGKRSSIAADSAKRVGYKNIAEYKGSWLDWATREGIQTPPVAL